VLIPYSEKLTIKSIVISAFYYCLFIDHTLHGTKPTKETFDYLLEHLGKNPHIGVALQGLADKYYEVPLTPDELYIIIVDFFAEYDIDVT